MGSTNLPRSGDDPTAERRKERPVADIDKATILITGATDGLGRRIARHLPASEAAILLVARPRREARRDHGARDREKTNNEKLRYYLADLSSLDEVRQLAEEVRADYDRLVILINNARVCLFENGLSPGMATS
jgi:NAD(P)-dependent dehydrogenase (short-subunit alcohol dehydrogenase family)